MDIALMRRVLRHWGLVEVNGMQGTAYDFRAVDPKEAGSWLTAVMEAFEEKYDRKPARFAIALPNLLLLV